MSVVNMVYIRDINLFYIVAHIPPTLILSVMDQ